MTTRMQQRRGDAAEWTAQNPILGDGEIGFERDTGELKIGNGVTHWNDLAYAFPSAAALAAKADLVGGKVPSGQLPAITTGEHVTVANQAAMLALTAAQVQPGDIAIRTDQSGHRYLLADPNPSILGNWIALETPGGVTSVQGYSGAVILAPADIGAQPSAAQLASIAALALAGQAGKVLTVKADASGYELDTPAAGGGGGVVGAFHGARAFFAATTQSIPSGGNIVTWDSETYDTDNYHSNSVNTSRFTVPAGLGGKYLISAMVDFAGNSTGVRTIAIYKNGAIAPGAWGNGVPGAVNATAASVVTIIDLVPGDYVEVLAWQNSGSAVNIQSNANGNDSRFEIAYLGNNGAVPGSTTTLRSTALLLAGNFSIPNAAWTAVPFTTERWDTANLHDNVTNPSRITIPVGGDGKYLFEASVDYANNNTGQRSAALYKNGAFFGYFGYGVSPAQGEIILTSTIIADAVAGDYFELAVYQTSGVALNALAGTTGTSFACNQLGAGVAAPLTLTAPSSADIPLSLKGAAGQTANLLDVRDSAAALKGGLDPAGRPIVSDRSTSARAGGAAPALPANPVGYFSVRGENGTQYWVPYYT